MIIHEDFDASQFLWGGGCEVLSERHQWKSILIFNSVTSCLRCIATSVETESGPPLGQLQSANVFPKKK